MVNWEEIRYEWESTAVSFKELAGKQEIKDATIRSRKNREKWQRNDATHRATKKKSVATEKKSRTQGTSGKSTDVHLHFEMSKGKWNNRYTTNVNPIL